MKNTRLQELIRVYAEQKWLDAGAAEQILKKILKILLTDKEESAQAGIQTDTRETQKTKRLNGGNEE